MMSYTEAERTARLLFLIFLTHCNIMSIVKLSYEVHVATEFQYIFSSLNTHLTLTNQIPHKLVPSGEEICSTASEASLTMTSSYLTE